LPSRVASSFGAPFFGSCFCALVSRSVVSLAVLPLMTAASIHIPPCRQGVALRPIPAWSQDRQIPMSTEEIEDVFIDLQQKFGFQRDSMRNMFDFLMHLLDSRASRMTPNQALLTIHADYIGGQHSNYRKWYFAAQLNLDDAVGQSQNPGLQRLKSVKGGGTGKNKSLDSALNRWRNAMNNMSQYDRLRQVALYLLCWGEAGNNRVDPIPEGTYLNTIIKP
ncbi:hypothetical protein MPER_01597, partial [Moniliophthora perniciosa FA553]